MAGIINITDDQSWTVSNWVYWNFMDHVLETVAEVPTATEFIESCKWMQSLSIPSMRKEDTAIANSVVGALRTAAQNCSEGSVICKVNGRVLDDASQYQFREATSELVSMLANLN